jgi:hypothetical protein
MQKKFRAPRATKADIDLGAPANVIIDKLGGLAAASRILSVPTSTLWSYAKKGEIPYKNWEPFKAAAKLAKITLRDSDFKNRAEPQTTPNNG